jgi:hypothetical protein
MFSSLKNWFLRDKNYIFVVVISIIFIIFIGYWFLTGKSIISNILMSNLNNNYTGFIEKKHNLTPINVEEEEENSTSINKIINMAHIYHHGKPDTYINNGNFKINGLKPQPIKAIKCYMFLIENGYYQYILDLASIYHYGCYQFLPQIDNAIKIYEKIIELNYPLLNTIAQQKLNELYNNPPIINDSDYYYKQQSHSQEKEKQSSSISSQTSTILFQPPHKQEGNIIYDIFNYDFLNPEIINNNIEQLEEINNNNRQNINHILLNRPNSQNIHDSGIVNSIKSSINKIKQNTPIKINKEESFNQIKNIIQNYNIGNTKKIDAIKALDHINNINGYVSSINMNEKDVLNLIWNRINNTDDNNNKNIIIENLINELSECIENNSTVCTQGRISRLVDSLNLIDKDVIIKDDITYRRELLNKASKIRNDIYEKLNDNEKIIVDKINPEKNENEFVEKYENDLKNNIYQQLKNEYVDNGLMEENKFKNEINKWINDII